MLKEFKEFIARGNVMDLAVGVIVGAAFTAIVNSLVKNLINPLLGIFVGSIDFSNLVFTVGDAHFRYGAFINSVINFLIIAFVVFLLVKFLNHLLPAPKDDEAADEPSAEEKYLKEIVDLLKKDEH
ncbi:large-conductance mechanosensitive channel protein MscL [Levilactobacillus zymae]|uniref:Large-conductance mechanosensitive channel n=1 Tax=Levilactobacillus zymae TaxID=267363 RepID=A0A1Y6K0R8_9LACO|nr:large-conductance mechanosensitive channel protein MscL [Levilactobacillus zymae]KRL15531.1 large-conductance mechanosensitive channel [Levilactobacillus zymae DSM 19395]QFR60797.1 large-conductance mechanosensitive channel protein MscL [Levilactobacillus zymae]GEO71018.1 large-conductance mechanosensitive channel [Levilactobacillus zymae]SMS14154.1 Large-conductance mechanosensitive channel [Levilactobacillus zymae]